VNDVHDEIKGRLNCGCDCSSAAYCLSSFQNKKDKTKNNFARYFV
jgi:hypothetical protein